MTLDLLCTRLATYLATLNATAFKHDTDDAFTESPVVLYPAWLPSSLSHLAFSVIPKGSPAQIERRHAPGGDCQVRSRIVVTLAYRIRPDNQVADHRLSMQAAALVFKAMNNVEAWDTSGHGEDVIPMPVDPYAPSAALDGNILLVDVAFDFIRFEVL